MASLRQNATFTGIEDLKERKKRGLPTPPPLDAKAKTDGEVVRHGGHRGDFLNILYVKTGLCDTWGQIAK